MIAFARGHKADAVGLRESDCMAGTHARGELPNSVLAIVSHRAAKLAGNVAPRVNVEIGRANLVDVEAQQLHAMGIDGAQVRGDKRVGHQFGGCPYDSDGFE